MEKEYPDWQYQPFRLNKEQITDPHQVIAHFFEDRGLPEHRIMLWEILSAAMSGNSADFFTGKEAGDWMLYFRELEEVIEASSLLIKQSNSK